jgi:hypothetical protein
MTKNDLVKLINKRLQSGWRPSEIQSGKVIDVNWKWCKELNHVIRLYEKNGWDIKKNVEISSSGRRLFLSFRNPEWLK